MNEVGDYWPRTAGVGSRRRAEILRRRGNGFGCHEPDSETCGFVSGVLRCAHCRYHFSQRGKSTDCRDREMDGRENYPVCCLQLSEKLSSRKTVSGTRGVQRRRMARCLSRERYEVARSSAGRNSPPGAAARTGTRPESAELAALSV